MEESDKARSRYSKEIDMDELLKKYAELLQNKNQSINLTSLKELSDIQKELIEDSLALADLDILQTGQTVLDLGTGGGVPGIPLAISYPNVSFALVDATQKKIAAVDEFVSQLNLKNVTTLAERAEELGQNENHREKYDVVVSKATAPLNVLLELTAPLAKVGGKIIVYKGSKYAEEIAEAENAIKELQLKVPEVHNYNLGGGDRAILVFKKLKPTPEKYPRRTGVPNKRPL